MRTELHFHLLPGVDDGPATADESMALARMAVVDGTATVVATPHARLVDVLSVPDRVRRLQARLDRERIPLQVVPGLELAQHDVARLTGAELDIAAHGPPGRRWVLLEAPVGGDPGPLPAAVDELAGRGYGVLIGHPERCPKLMTADRMLDDLLDAGAELQLNGSSLTGLHGEHAREWAIELALTGRASVIASDAHGPKRGAVLSAAVSALATGRLPADRAEAMVSTAARRLLEDGLRRRRGTSVATIGAGAPGVPRRETCGVLTRRC